MRLIFYFLLGLMITASCEQKSKYPNGRISENFDIQGHRGCRGHVPENSMEGFIRAVTMGATTLEMDVVITKDNHVILSHEPWISSKICLDSTSSAIHPTLERKYNIYQMNYREVLKFNCGSIHQPAFQDQESMDIRKPTLNAVIKAVENFVRSKNMAPVQYNIETKCSDQGDGVYHPLPEIFAALVLDVINENMVADRTILQSFDPRTLNAAHDLQPELRTALLVTNQLGYGHNLQRLDHVPTIYSPNKSFLTESMVNYMHERNIQVIPWTVNDMQEMEKYITLGVDGIITDYPDRLKSLVWDLGI